MVEKIKIENSTEKDMQICIEPLAEYIDWRRGKFVEIELKLLNNGYADELNIALTQQVLVIYECRQYEMKLFIDNELKYYTPENRYR